MTDTMYPALLRYWRNARGMSQLDLAAAADVSPKHVSFLETGRSTPSREMVLRLASTLGLPLRDQNAMLTAAGFSPAFADVDAARHDPAIQRALATMMKKHEPYPMLVFDRNYDIVQVNAAAQRMLHLLLGPRAGEERNIMRLIFDPGLLRPQLLEWDKVARAMLVRLQRDALLHHRRDDDLRRLVSALCSYEGVPNNWREPDFTASSDATLQFRVRHEGHTLSFLTTLTVFSAPQNVALEELHIESYYPLDEATETLCRHLAG